MLQCVGDVKAEKTTWLWENRVPLGMLGILAGPPKRGKSQMTCAMAAPVTTGGLWPDGARAPLGSVIFIGCEDDVAKTIRPRLEAAGADVSKVHVYNWTIVPGGQGNIKRLHFDVQQHAPSLEQAILDLGDVRLIVFDPISAYMGKADSYKVAEVRAALLPVQTLANQYDVSVCMITHLNKNHNVRSAMDRVSGSGAFVAVARWSFLIDFDPDDETKNKRDRRRFLAPMGANVGNDGEGFWFHIEGATTIDGIPSSRVVFDGQPVEMDADDLMRPRQDPSPVIQAAMDFLKAELADGKEHAAAPIIETANAQGLSNQSLFRASERLRVIKRKENVPAGGWLWRVPVATPTGLTAHSA